MHPTRNSSGVAEAVANSQQMSDPKVLGTIVIYGIKRSVASWACHSGRQLDDCSRVDLRFTIYCGAYRIRIPTPNAATRGLQHRSVAVGPQTVRMLLGGLIHLRSSQPERLLEVASQLRSRHPGRH